MSGMSMQDKLAYIRLRRAGVTPEAMLKETTDKVKGELAERASQTAQAVLQRERLVDQTLEPLNRAVEAAKPLETAQQQLVEIQTTLGKLKSIQEQLITKQTQVDKDMEKQRKLKAEAAAYFRELRAALAKRSADAPYLSLFYEAGDRMRNYGSKRIHPHGSHLPQPSPRVEQFCSQRPPCRANRNGVATPAESGTSRTSQTDRNLEDGGRPH